MKVLYVSPHGTKGDEEDNLILSALRHCDMIVIENTLSRIVDIIQQYEIVFVILRAVAAADISSFHTMIRSLRRSFQQLFICIYGIDSNPAYRYNCFQHGGSMVSHDSRSILAVLEIIRTDSIRTGPFICPFCNKKGFTEDQLWRHCPLYHINEVNAPRPCPICRNVSKRPFQVHMHNCHGPPGRGDSLSEFRMKDTMLYSFALVVCRNPRTNKFLLVQEFANVGYWLPGGGVDAGEDPKQAAIRETKEEAGIDIVLTGLIRLEYTPKGNRDKNPYVRMRFIFTAEPRDVYQAPKSIPDYESVGASWCSVEELPSLPLRGKEPTEYFTYVHNGGKIYPLSTIVTP